MNTKLLGFVQWSTTSGPYATQTHKSTRNIGYWTPSLLKILSSSLSTGSSSAALQFNDSLQWLTTFLVWNALLKYKHLSSIAYLPSDNHRVSRLFLFYISVQSIQVNTTYKLSPEWYALKISNFQNCILWGVFISSMTNVAWRNYHLHTEHSGAFSLQQLHILLISIYSIYSNKFAVMSQFYFSFDQELTSKYNHGHNLYFMWTSTAMSLGYEVNAIL